MRRLGILMVLTVALVASLGATTLAAKPAPAFKAHASAATQGGSLHISAKVLHVTRSTTFSATAVVHFASGDVSVVLKRAGHSFHAGVRVPVAADAALGPVAVDVTISYGVTTQVVSVWGKIQPADSI